jgi:hypothetical protein
MDEIPGEILAERGQSRGNVARWRFLFVRSWPDVGVDLVARIHHLGNASGSLAFVAIKSPRLGHFSAGAAVHNRMPGVQRELSIMGPVIVLEMIDLPGELRGASGGRIGNQLHALGHDRVPCDQGVPDLFIFGLIKQ